MPVATPKRLVTINLKMSEAERAALLAECERRGLSKGAYVRKLFVAAGLFPHTPTDKEQVDAH